MRNDICTNIRNEIKKLGFNNRQVSVRGDSSSVRVSVKVRTSLTPIENICKNYESISYDQYSGEILSGGNTYVHANYDWEFVKTESAAYHEISKKFIETIQHKGSYEPIAENDNVVVLFDGVEIIINIKNETDDDFYIAQKRYCAYNFYQFAESIFYIECEYGKVNFKGVLI